MTCQASANRFFSDKHGLYEKEGDDNVFQSNFTDSEIAQYGRMCQIDEDQVLSHWDGTQRRIQEDSFQIRELKKDIVKSFQTLHDLQETERVRLNECPGKMHEARVVMMFARTEAEWNSGR